MYTTHEQSMVEHFHRRFGVPAPKDPQLLGSRTQLRIDLIMEEAQEFADAARHNDWLAMIDALCDLLYVTYGAAVEMGVDLGPFFDEVHAANMRKEGGATRNDGKILKPAGWQPPDHQTLYEGLYGEAE